MNKSRTKKNISITFKIFCSVVAISILLTLNWDKVELEGRSMVITLGIDKHNDNYIVYSCIPSAKSMTENENDEPDILQDNAESVEEALKKIENKTSDSIYYAHTKAIILGEDVLKQQDLLYDILDMLEKEYYINIKTIVMASKQNVEDILKAKPSGQSNLGLFLTSYYKIQEKEKGAHVNKIDLEGVSRGLLLKQKIAIPLILHGDELIIEGEMNIL